MFQRWMIIKYNYYWITTTKLSPNDSQKHASMKSGEGNWNRCAWRVIDSIVEPICLQVIMVVIFKWLNYHYLRNIILSFTWLIITTFSENFRKWRNRQINGRISSIRQFHFFVKTNLMDLIWTGNIQQALLRTMLLLSRFPLVTC